MTPHGPPRNEAGAHHGEVGAGRVEALGGGIDTSNIAHSAYRTAPFDFAETYRAKGWTGTLPLGERRKFPPPGGVHRI
jgi:hypothetical protein